MAALTASRITPQWGDDAALKLRALPVKANTKLFKGGLVVADAGYAAPGRTATGLKAAGVALVDWDNLTATVGGTGGGAGAITATVAPGVFKFLNSTSGDLIAQSDVFTICYIVDDQTVAKTSNSSARSIAGIVEGVDSDGGVWVSVGAYAGNGS